jgi:L-aspartate oxidase
MTAGAGVVRDHASLKRTGPALVAPPPADERETLEVRNLVDVGRAVVAAADAREESRGCHTRADYPDPSPAFERRLVVR